MDDSNLPDQLLDLLDLLGVRSVLWEKGLEAACLAAQDRIYDLRSFQVGLGNLLAVIHRDGGHYQAEHGLERACADAEKVVIDLRMSVSALEESHRILVESEDPW